MAVFTACPLAAEPTLEASKAMSGARFSETLGLPSSYARETPAVYAGSGGARPAAASYSQRPGRRTRGVPGPSGPGDAPSRSGDSVGARILAGALGAAAVGATGLAMFLHPLAGAALVAGAAIAGGVAAKKAGAKWWGVVKGTARGVGHVFTGIFTAGAKAGFGLGKLLERVF